MATNGQKIEYNSADIRKKPKVNLITNIDKSRPSKKPVDKVKARKHANVLAVVLATLVILAVALGIFLLTANQNVVKHGDGVDTTGLAQPENREDMAERKLDAIFSDSDGEKQAVIDDYDRAINEAAQNNQSTTTMELDKASFLANIGQYDEAIQMFESLLSKNPTDEEKSSIYRGIIFAATALDDKARVVKYCQLFLELPQEITQYGGAYYQTILDQYRGGQ
jgi:tetratricopeptide (TPR) repeat protein